METVCGVFPRTTVAGVSLPRLLIGTNWILGYSHRSPAADSMIQKRNLNRDAICSILDAYLSYGIDAVMAPFAANPVLFDAIHQAEQKHGRKIILIDTPVIDVSDNEAAREQCRRDFQNSAKRGSRFCLIHHSSAEQLVDKGNEALRRLPDYLAMIREAGMIPGLSAHMPELILYSDKNGYDVETYIQIFNCAGYMMQVEIETVARIIHEAKKPVMTIKPMAAGRLTPYVGLTFNFAAIRECDMITLGAFTPEEVHEDVDIAFGALEHRLPRVGMRNSPADSQSILRGKTE
jgi:hypothetical protein